MFQVLKHLWYEPLHSKVVYNDQKLSTIRIPIVVFTIVFRNTVVDYSLFYISYVLNDSYGECTDGSAYILFATWAGNQIYDMFRNTSKELLHIVDPISDCRFKLF